MATQNECSNQHLRLVILVDNQAANSYSTEHGFSLWIDTGTEQIVFDTGQGPALANNARRLGIDWRQLDHLVLSHGHYDHTGGVAYLLRRANGIHVHCHPAVVQPRYSIHLAEPRPIHMPSDSRSALNHVPEFHLHWVLRSAMLGERIGLSGPIPRMSSAENTGGAFYLDPQGRRPDPIEDDMALWVHTVRGLVVVVGCCHAGLINTLQHIRQLNPGQRIHAVIGGFHLLDADADRLRQTIAALHRYSPDRVIACHCTGEHAMAALHDSLGPRFSVGAAGNEYCM